VFQVQYDGDVVSAGNITAFGASGNFLNVSDERLKKNIHTISESLDRILELRPTEFVWKENEKRDIGFIAQEVEEIIPEVVETSKGFLDTHTDDKSQDDVKTVSYSKLTPYLVDTIQELTKRIEELEKKVK
jgi:ATP-dependent protease HslVU (ClpYQ) ATPase subunit